jgi:molybdopterin synthase sulfur carrier subunit
MVTISFLGPIEHEEMKLDVSSLKELKNILSEDESISRWLLNSAIAVNDNIVTDINTPLKDGDTIALLPPVCGG